MAAINRNIKTLYHRTSGSFFISLSVFLGPKNLGVAFRIALLSSIQAELYAFAYLLPVNGDRIWFAMYPYIGQLGSGPRKQRVAVWIVLLIKLNMSNYKYFGFRSRHPSWFCDFRLMGYCSHQHYRLLFLDHENMRLTWRLHGEPSGEQCAGRRT